MQRFLVGLAVLAALGGASRPAAAEDDLAAFRDRFRAGLQRLEAGQTAEAILIWEAVYGELGPSRGYRLAYNLGIAYDRFGDTSRASERFEAFLTEANARIARGEPLDASVQRQRDDAEERLAELGRSKARVRVSAEPRVPAQVDAAEARLTPFTAVLTPGSHVITFEPGSIRARRVELEVKEGQTYDIEAPAAPTPTEPKRKDEEQARPPKDPTPKAVIITRPFPWPVFVGAAGATVLSVALPVVMYRRAGDVRERYDASRDPAEQDSLAAEYERRRNTAYGSLAVPITLGVATLGLSVWYSVGTKSTLVTAGPGSLGVRHSF